jgi:hypothetical protein
VYRQSTCERVDETLCCRPGGRGSFITRLHPMAMGTPNASRLQPVSNNELRNHRPSQPVSKAWKLKIAAPPVRRPGGGELPFSASSRCVPRALSVRSAAMAADAQCRHCPTEQLIDLVLNSAHERLRARCDRSKILNVLEDNGMGHTMVRRARCCSKNESSPAAQLETHRLRLRASQEVSNIL